MSRSLLLLLLLLAVPAAAQSVFVVNQGNFSEGDGSVTVLSGALDGDPEQLFDGQLGSILQSATLLDQLYLVSNSANRIDVVDPATRQRTGQITGPFRSPRYLVAANGDRAYVSNQVYGGTSFVLPVDLATQATGAAIPVDGLPEGMAPVGGLPDGETRMYVALGAFGPGAGGRDSLAVLSLTRDALVGYVEIGCYASFVVAADPGVMAFCPDTDEAVVVSAQTDAVVQRIAFGEDIGDPFGVGQGVAYGGMALARRPAAIPVDPFYVTTASGFAVVERGADGWAIARRVRIPEAATRTISAIGVEASGDRRVILGRPDPTAPFSADGTVTIHDGTTGALLATIGAGVYPAHVVTQDESFLVATDDALSSAVGLAFAGPNPARAQTALALTLDRAAAVRVDVLDVLGRPVLRLADGPLGAGAHRLAVDASALPAGVYLIRATTGGVAATLALTVAR